MRSATAVAAKAAATDSGTTFQIKFDFTGDDQRKILNYFQAHDYKLFGFKGADGPSQVTQGLPTWFAYPFKEVFGADDIKYKPLYKVYVFNQASIGANTTIEMEELSDPQPLGTAITFNEDGSWSANPTTAPADSIVVFNNRSAGTTNVTIGLAAVVNDVYQPFCAFTSTPQSTIAMTPHEEICLFAAQTDLKSGTVTAAAAAPGCTFAFSAVTLEYDLMFLPSTYGITSQPGTPAVTPTTSGADLAELLNS